MLVCQPAAGAQNRERCSKQLEWLLQSLGQWESSDEKIRSDLVDAAARAFAVLPARAQVTIDVSKITCQQYVLFTVADPRDIAMWLSGYYNSKRNNTVLDTQEFRERARKVMEYCQLNPKTTVMEAVERVTASSK